eukprot:798802-Alexandrium_andersonii.AAC.1
MWGAPHIHDGPVARSRSSRRARRKRAITVKATVDWKIVSVGCAALRCACMRACVPACARVLRLWCGCGVLVMWLWCCCAVAALCLCYGSGVLLVWLHCACVPGRVQKAFRGQSSGIQGALTRPK